jgi:hypothetical protein
MEGKEVRFGISQQRAVGHGDHRGLQRSVNAMHDSFMPLAGMVPMWLMQLGEVIFGGVGSGLYGMLMFAIVAVFIAGLMVGRTPEYLGKKIEAYEMKMASLAVLVPLFAGLVGTALACVVPETKRAIANPGIHGFSEILYAFSSSSNNNGSAFAGLTASGMFYATAQGITMLMGPLLDHRAGARHRGLSGAQEICAAERGHAADAHTALRFSAGRRGHYHRRAHVLSGPSRWVPSSSTSSCAHSKEHHVDSCPSAS